MEVNNFNPDYQNESAGKITGESKLTINTKRNPLFRTNRKLLMFLLGFILVYESAHSQDIHKLEPAKNHYKVLQTLNSEPNSERGHLDHIEYPSNMYNSGSLLYLMVPPEYLNMEQIEKLKLTVNPPANSSDQTNAELELLLEWQNKRTESQEERAFKVLAPLGYWPHISLVKSHNRYQSNLEDLFFEGRTILGEQCKPEIYPATTKLLEGVTKDMRIMEFTVKYHILRPRPYQLDSNLIPLAQMSTPSFASGHTLWAYIQAFVWSELIPDKRKEFLELAYEIGESREIMGIHYPSDEEAARVLAHKMLSAMFVNPKFKEDLKKAKLEWN